MAAPVKYLFFSIIYCSCIFSQWTTVNQLNNLGEYPTISVPDCNTVITAGGSASTSVIYRSTNGGINFANITSALINRDLYALWALNKDTIYTGDGGAPGGIGGNAKIYMTTNGGVNWADILSTGGSSGFISGIMFERPLQNFGIIVSDPPFGTDSFWIAKTTNKGGSWVITRAPQTAPFSTQKSLFVVDPAFYGFGLISTPGKIFITSNGGSNWIVRSIGLNGNSTPSTVFQSDKLNGISISDNGLPSIARTTNGGNNWQSFSTGTGSSGIGTIKWVPGTNIYYMCASRIKRSSNGGQSWEEMNTGGVFNFVHMDLISTGPNSICAYALASDGRVLKYEGEPFGIKQISNEVPLNFELMQNYPNPFNPVTKFKFRVSGTDFISIKIFNSNGKEIRVLLNESLAPGTYEIEFDATDMPSGIYYYSISTSGFADTKKMALVK